MLSGSVTVDKTRLAQLFDGAGFDLWLFPPVLQPAGAVALKGSLTSGCAGVYLYGIEVYDYRAVVYQQDVGRFQVAVGQAVLTQLQQNSGDSFEDFITHGRFGVIAQDAGTGWPRNVLTQDPRSAF